MNDTEVLFIIASHDFQPLEYSRPKKIIENAGFSVITTSDKDSAIAQDKSYAYVNLTLDKVVVNNYAGIFFIGGPGALDHLDNNTSYKIIQDAYAQHKPIGAICISTRILAKSGILDGKYATGWNGDNKLAEIYKEYNITYLPEEKVVVDSNIITATDPSAAEEFGNRIVQLLQSKQNWG